jgi:hypothetical protein
MWGHALEGDLKILTPPLSACLCFLASPSCAVLIHHTLPTRICSLTIVLKATGSTDYRLKPPKL